MPVMPIPPPVALDRNSRENAVHPANAVVLSRLNLWMRKGRVIRGPGFSPCSEVAKSSFTLNGGGVFTRRDCRMLLVDSNTNGDWRASMSSGFGVLEGWNCCGPLPAVTELVTEDDDWVTYVDALNDSPTIIYPNALAGKNYEIIASGRWTSLVAANIWYGPEGYTDGAPINYGPPDDQFDGFYYGELCVRHSGSTVWTASDGYSVQRVNVDGPIEAQFADLPYGDNGGSMTVIVRPL